MATSFKRLAGVLALTLAALLTPVAPASAAPADDPLFGKVTIRLPDIDVSPASVLNLGPGGLLQTGLPAS
ncbi:hypothetical protein [Streptomyces agglomeratus]|uniref:hypothetical protein n=1 Tax=Streptomyces agglomeratus TaxID=285458 RepID=UPI00114D1B71|nr:hypothetical protein [Streptomyces agglomeratus]